MKALITLDGVNHISNIKGLRNIYDRIEAKIRSLEKLDIKPEMYRPLLIPIILRKDT